MKQHTALAVAVAFAFSLIFTSVAQADRPAPRKQENAATTAARSVRTSNLRGTARKWETLISLPRAHTRFGLRSPLAYLFWKRRARAVARAANAPPHKKGWLCIHRFEGRWSDSGDPYWGGLQMNQGFMQTYAPRSLLRRGWANVWTPLEQMWVAERAHRSGRGYGPWPTTARACGLL